MKIVSRWLWAIAALLLLMLFVFPFADNSYCTQYPDGITLYIWVNQITGDSPGTLQNINILNHYVGMKYIEPDSIPELTYFPYIIGFMTVLGLIFAFIGKRIYISYGPF